MKKIGFVNLGYRADVWLTHIQHAGTFEVVGFYNQPVPNVKEHDYKIKIPLYTSPFSLIAHSDLLIIAKKDDVSFNLMVECVLNTKHIVIDNPASLTVKDIDLLLKLNGEAAVSIVPFLSYRFLSSVLEVKSYVINPQFINVNYLSFPEFNIGKSEFRGVLLNLIDLVVILNKGNVRRVSSTAVPIVGIDPHFTGCRIDFDNGCAGNITIERIASYETTAIAIYQKRQIAYINLLNNEYLIKQFFSDNVLECEVKKSNIEMGNNVYEEVLNYIKAFESYNSSISPLETLRTSLNILSKIEEKIK